MDGVINVSILLALGLFVWKSSPGLQETVARIRAGLDSETGFAPARRDPTLANRSEIAEQVRRAGVPLVDRPLVQAIIDLESSGNPDAHRNTDNEDSRGLMQVQLDTARGLWDLGVPAVTRFQRAELGKVLFDPDSAIRIGYAFIEYLRRKIPPEWKTSARTQGEWVVRAYNGGEKWDKKGPGLRAKTQEYFQRFLAALGRQGGVY